MNTTTHTHTYTHYLYTELVVSEIEKMLTVDGERGLKKMAREELD